MIRLRAIQRSLLFSSFLLIFCACSDDSGGTLVPRLTITPSELEFPVPEPGETRRVLAFTLRNAGDMPLTVSQVVISERDANSEIALLDEDDWQKGVLFEPGQKKTLALMWTPLDGRADEGEIVVSYGQEENLSATFITTKIEPRIRLETVPHPSESTSGTMTVFDQAMLGQTQRGALSIIGNSIAEALITRVCLLDQQQNCTVDQISPFRVCLETSQGPSDCVLPDVPFSLTQDTDHRLALFYSPGSSNVTHGARVLITSNDADEPNRVLKLQGRPCFRLNSGDTCGTCGNGTNDPFEACDDGNLEETDDCLNHCVAARCGDGLVHNGVEECDDGNANDQDACTNACTAAHCGDGRIQTGEDCDDGNHLDNDQCPGSCQPARCGDGFIWDGMEDCDDGNHSNEDACTNLCVEATCGDGFLHRGVEACDDGNENSNDACTTLCQPARCGDGVVFLSVESCDDGNSDQTDGCLNDCTLARCGDGHIRDGHEECDDGNTQSNDGCLPNCLRARCGDGFVQLGVETCDDGNQNDFDACPNTCQPARCGDGVVQVGHEECDDGNADNSDGCTNTCHIARCGDGFVQLGVETCDHGTVTDTQSLACPYGEIQCTLCNRQCQSIPGQPSFCGDGEIQGAEACDDGPTPSPLCPYGETACQVCTAQCTLMDGATSHCGDGQIDEALGEECDPGEALELDCQYGEERCEVCHASCRYGDGNVSFCGDGIVNGPEICDGRSPCNSDCSGYTPFRPLGSACNCSIECLDGPCINGVCAESCTDDCPAEQRCVQIANAESPSACPEDSRLPETIGICSDDRLGLPCSSDIQCSGGECIDSPSGSGEAFCTTPCTEHDECWIAGFSCQDGQCRPPESLGQCNGSPLGHCGYCENADDCPAGSACLQEPGTFWNLETYPRVNYCFPVVGSFCTTGWRDSCNFPTQCIIWDDPLPFSYCSTVCLYDTDCPTGYYCEMHQPNRGIGNLLPTTSSIDGFSAPVCRLRQ